MNFYEELDAVMKQDFGNRGLLASLPPSPAAETAGSLCGAKRVLLLTGFPVRTGKDSFTGETDGPSGTANLAAALAGARCQDPPGTDAASAPRFKGRLGLSRAEGRAFGLAGNGNRRFYKKLHPGFLPHPLYKP